MVTNNLSYFYEDLTFTISRVKNAKMTPTFDNASGFFVSFRSELPVVSAFEKIWTSWILWNVMTYDDY